MDAEKVMHALNRRFAAPLPEFCNRRIIFRYDDGKEFGGKVDEVQFDKA